MDWLPLIITFAVFYFLKLKKKRITFPIVIMIYIFSIFLIILTPIFLELKETGQGDPQLVAGMISESLIMSLYRTIFDVPILAVLFWWSRRQHI